MKNRTGKGVVQKGKEKYEVRGKEHEVRAKWFKRKQTIRERNPKRVRKEKD
jgi:hypothetical protein